MAFRGISGSPERHAWSELFEFLKEFAHLRKVRFLLEGGGGGGALEGRIISKILTNWVGPNLFCSQPGEGHTFFGKEKNLNDVASIKVDSFIC